MNARTTLSLLAGLLAMAAVAAPGAAHESYTTDDGKFIIILGEQNEPVYTYDWTNLDLFVRENATGGDVPGVEETVTATLIAPGGEEMWMPIEPQFRTVGQYEFSEDYILTQPGQYKVRLEGDINGTDVTGDYLLPGPRTAMEGHTFPSENVPTLLDLQEENQALRDRIAELEERMTAMEDHMDAMMVDGASGDGADGGSDGAATAGNSTPGVPALALLVAVGCVALAFARRRSD